MQQVIRRSLLRAFSAALLVATLAAACSSISGTDRTQADNARVMVSGSSAVPLTIVTSTQFLTSRGPEGEELIGLLRSDTAQLSLPIDKTVPFNGSDRFFLLVRNPDINSTSVVDIRVLVDGKEVLRQPASLRDAAVHFTYYLF